jgi:hypothetical protein
MSSDLDNGLTIFGLSIVHMSISVLTWQEEEEEEEAD